MGSHLEPLWVAQAPRHALNLYRPLPPLPSLFQNPFAKQVLKLLVTVKDGSLVAVVPVLP
jgi:hypothetical protein